MTDKWTALPTSAQLVSVSIDRQVSFQGSLEHSKDNDDAIWTVYCIPHIDLFWQALSVITSNLSMVLLMGIDSLVSFYLSMIVPYLKRKSREENNPTPSLAINKSYLPL